MMRRPTMSLPVPAGNGMTYRTGLVGKFCDQAAAAPQHATATLAHTHPRLTALAPRITHLPCKGTATMDGPRRRSFTGRRANAKKQGKRCKKVWHSYRAASTRV